ncbi:hypothetical protein E2C01_008911 [Portunus trituberculatus]|uniref:Uncharacterized protein n=1 Tax=Portunus trituberculatus TaxID=210409 RepID=A0A5B7D447_PORTR|nr:hypothetical protein [Portunus trituberculatus]
MNPDRQEHLREPPTSRQMALGPQGFPSHTLEVLLSKMGDKNTQVWILPHGTQHWVHMGLADMV